MSKEINKRIVQFHDKMYSDHYSSHNKKLKPMKPIPDLNELPFKQPELSKVSRRYLTSLRIDLVYAREQLLQS